MPTPDDRSVRALQQRIAQIHREQELDERIVRLQLELADALSEQAAFRDVAPGEQDAVIDLTASSRSSSSGDEDELPEPIWDDRDQVYRCVDCGFEVCGGWCAAAQCNRAHAYESQEEDEDDNGNHANLNVECTAPSSVRLPHPRGSTPLLDVAVEVAPATFPGTFEAYKALLQRGATPAMVELFRLEWIPVRGITAYATPDIFHDWAGPSMERGDIWKIALGRRIELNQRDVDGSRWIQDFLDDVLEYPDPGSFWETVLERRGVWVNRPKTGHDGPARGNPNANAAATLEPIAYFDEYEDESSDEDDMDEDLATVDRGAAQEGNAQEVADVADAADEEESNDEDYTFENESQSEEDGDISASGVVRDGMDIDSSCDDSDQPGSGWDSEEELSGDEEARAEVRGIVGRMIRIPPPIW